MTFFGFLLNPIEASGFAYKSQCLLFILQSSLYISNICIYLIFEYRATSSKLTIKFRALFKDIVRKIWKSSILNIKIL